MSGRILSHPRALGRLYRAIRGKGKRIPNITLVENSPDCCRELYSMTERDTYATIKQADFLSIEPAREGNCGLIIKQLPEAFYDLRNHEPAFQTGKRRAHLTRLEICKTGRCCHCPVLQWSVSKQTTWGKPLADTWEVLPGRNIFQEGQKQAQYC